MNKIGSVGTGLGQAVKERIERRDIKFAKDEPLLKDFIQDVPELLNSCLDKGGHVLLEGTQGIKLSLLHGEYPFVTSRDTTASTFLGEAGLGPKSVRDVYVVFKPYITRVGPGPLEKEMFDEKELEIYHTKGHEIGSVSKRLRRVGEFEWKSAARALMINNCTKIAITHMDMFDGNDCVKDPAKFTAQAKKFLADLQALSDKVYPHPKIALISTGPDMEDTLVM